MVTSEELNGVFEETGNDFHLVEAFVEFAPFRYLKIS